MKLLLKWVTELPHQWSASSEGEALIMDFMEPEEQYSTVYYKYHDGIGHQWTDNIKLAKEFTNEVAIDELILDLQDHNYAGVFGVEESIITQIDALGDL